MSSPKIIGSVQVKNEDVYVKQVILNLIEFCDEVIVTDNLSTDKTYKICEQLAQKHPKISLKKIRHPREAATLLEPYFGKHVWIFGVDGDEIYDPKRLRVMRERILNEEFSDAWCIFGNVLNVVSLDLLQKKAKGYLAPPSRSMTKLYNFALIESWTNCPERLLGDEIVFRLPYHMGLRRLLHEEVSWEQSDFRCLHVPFLKRSSQQKISLLKTRLNPDEIEYVNRQTKSFLRILRRLELYLRQAVGRDWKSQKYRQGHLVSKDIASFFPDTLESKK